MSWRLKALERMHPALASSLPSRGNSPTNDSNDDRAASRRATCFGFTFDQELETSPVYKRAALNELRQSQSSTSSHPPSSLSGLSLCDVSDASAIALPISSMELWNHHRYTSGGKRLEASVSSLEAWYNPPAKVRFWFDGSEDHMLTWRLEKCLHSDCVLQRSIYQPVCAVQIHRPPNISSLHGCT